METQVHKCCPRAIAGQDSPISLTHDSKDREHPWKYRNLTNLRCFQQPIHNSWWYLEPCSHPGGDKLCQQPLAWRGDSRSAGWQSLNGWTLSGNGLFLGANDENSLYCCKFDSALQGYHL